MLRRKKTYKVPSSIMVGGIKFKVVIKKMDDYGSMHFDDRVISIAKGLSPEVQLDTLIHEAHHAALEIGGLTSVIDDENIEEAIVRTVDNILIPVIKQEYKKFYKDL